MTELYCAGCNQALGAFEPDSGVNVWYTTCKVCGVPNRLESTFDGDYAGFKVNGHA